MSVRLALVLTFCLTWASASVHPWSQLPNFAGAWTLDAAQSSATGGGQGKRDASGGGQGGGLGLGPSPTELFVDQKEFTLRLDFQREAGGPHLIYRLNGTPETNELPAGRNAGVKITTVSKWQDSRLVTTTTLPASAEGGAAVYEETRWLEPDGTMVVEIQRPGTTNLRRSVYKRK